MFGRKVKIENKYIIDLLKDREIHGYNIYIKTSELKFAYLWRKNIYISKALFRHLRDYELTALIFHEIGHAELKHRKTNLINLIITAFAMFIIIWFQLYIPAIIYFFTWFIIYSKFIRDQEHRADLFAASNYSHRQLIVFLYRMKNKSTLTHPSYIQRIRYIEKYFED